MSIESNFSAGQKARELASSSLLLPLIIAGGAILRFIGLGNNSLWCDEFYTIWVSRLPADSYFNALSSWGHPPVYYLLGRIWFGLGNSDAWVRSISFAAGVAAIFLVFLVGRELFSRQVGLWGALLAALSPLLISYSRDATYYSWLTVATLLAFYMLVRSAIRGGWQNWTLFTLTAIVAITSHLFSFVLLPAFAGVYLILRDRNRKSLLPFVVSHLTLAIVFVATWMFAHNANGLINIKFPLKILLVKLALIPDVLLGGGFNDFGSGAGGMIVTYGRAHGIVFFDALLLILTFLPLAFIYWRRKDLSRTFFSKRAIALVFYTVVLSVVPVIIHNVVDVPEQPSQRFYLWAAPTFMLIVALILVSLPARVKLAMGALVIAGFSTMTLWGVFFYHPLDFETPLHFVSDNYQRGDLLFSSPYEIAFMASGHDYPASLKMGGLFQSAEERGPGDYFFLPSDDDIFVLMTSNYKQFDDKYLASGADLRHRAEDSIKGADRIWDVIYYDHDDHEYCIGCDVLDGVFEEGWQEQTWSFDSGRVHLYTRVKPPRTS